MKVSELVGSCQTGIRKYFIVEEDPAAKVGNLNIFNCKSTYIENFLDLFDKYANIEVKKFDIEKGQMKIFV